MKKIQRFFVAGTSLLIVCIMAIASVLALGNISKNISITIHYDADIRAEILAATFSGATDKMYHQEISTHDAEGFSTTKTGEVYDNALNLYSTNNDAGDITNNVAQFYANGGFQLTEEGYLEIYFLVTNYESVQLQYYLDVTFGTPDEDNIGDATSEYLQLLEYATVYDDELEEDVADVTKSTPLGTEGSPNYVVANVKDGEGNNTPGVSLIKLVFSLIDITMTPSFGGEGEDAINESININLWLDRA